MRSADAASGRLPPGYQLVRILGHGGSGWVALARQTALDRDVAIKLVLTGAHDRAGLRRLEREGRVIVSLAHPRIVSAYALLPWQAGAALVMEYLPGGDLRTLMNSGRLTGTAASTLLSEIAEGLTHAHDRGIAHRDVKPENVLLTEQGNAKVADFGLARLPRAAGAFRTAADQRTGTPAYMAPEQITDPGAESPAVDSYAFAVLAYEMLAGVRPLTGRDIGDLLRAHRYDAPRAPWEVRPGFPETFGRQLIEGLSKRPEDRPTVSELADGLRAVPPSEWEAVVPRRPPSPPIAAETSDAATRSGTIAATSFVRSAASVDLDDQSAPPAAQSFSGVVLSPAYQPPAEPFWRRRALYLPLALCAGLVLGLVVAIVLGS